MLRVTFEKGPSHTIVMRLEGRLIGNFGEAVKIALMRRKLKRKLLVELSDVTFVDEAGEEVLLWLGGIGAEFVAESSHSRFLCGRLQLPIALQVASACG
jgi:hypothetical protein